MIIILPTLPVPLVQTIGPLHPAFLHPVFLLRSAILLLAFVMSLEVALEVGLVLGGVILLPGF